MANLHPNQLIEFEDTSEFLGHYDSHISKGGFYLDTLADWELRKTMEFSLKVVGVEEKARIKAEVVFCGGGKVGLQMADDPANKAQVAGLVHSIRSNDDNDVPAGPLATPTLKDDGTILYQSVADFLADYDTNIAAGGTYAESSQQWPSGHVFPFLMHIEGQADFDFSIRAKVVFVGGGLVGLQVEADESAREGMSELVELLRDEEDEPPPEAVFEEKQKQAQPIWKGLVYSTRDPDEFVPLEIFEVRLDVKPQTTPFGLMASLAKAKKPMRLEIVNNQITLVFRFKSDGTIVDFEGPRADEDLLDRMVKSSFIDESLQKELLGYLGEGTTAATLIARRKAANRQQVMIALGQQVVEALETIRAAGELPFRVFAEEEEYEPGVCFESLIIPWLDQALKALSADMVKSLLKPMWKNALQVRADAIWDMELMGLDKHSRKFVRSLDGKKPLPKAVGDFDKRLRDRLFRLAISLKTLRVVDVLKAAAAANQTDAKIASLAKELERLRKADKFSQGGVHWSAHPHMYEKAMMELQREFGRSSPFARSSKEAARLCQHRIELAKVAHLFLKEDFQRQEYRKDTFKSGLLADTAKLLYQKGQAQIGEDNPRGSIEFLEMAVELDDQPEYRNKLQSVLKHLEKNKGS